MKTLILILHVSQTDGTQFYKAEILTMAEDGRYRPAFSKFGMPNEEYTDFIDRVIEDVDHMKLVDYRIFHAANLII